MKDKEKKQLQFEIRHIFDSGANEIRVYEMVIQLIEKREAENMPVVSGSLLLHDLFQVAAIKNEDEMEVIKYIDKPNGGSVAYVRYDAVVNKLNSLNALLNGHNNNRKI